MKLVSIDIFLFIHFYNYYANSEFESNFNITVE